MGGPVRRIYDDLGLDRLGDETFRALVLARVIEPASKLDAVRVPTKTRVGLRIGDVHALP